MVEWSPDAEGGFDPGLFAELAALEQQNFWFVARNRLIRWALRREVAAPRRILEIGCGTGFVLAGLAEEYPRAHLIGTELFEEALPFVRERLPGAELRTMDARHIDVGEQVDVVGAFDVIEHVVEDDVVLDQVFAALRPGGTLAVTVPQHRWLWSSADVHAHHVRRYTARELRDRVRAAGLEVRYETSFVTLLLPLMVASRLARRSADHDAAAELALPRVVNAVCATVMTVELALLRWGLRFPMGGSRLMVARRPEEA
ncbi:hypothetical protein ASD11_13860 [Aeromicrobium sp. Root495]|nr:hypothetical protein ASD11_13860 [Aeromicrobium sp. Root495]